MRLDPHHLHAERGVVGWTGGELGLVFAPGLVPGAVALHHANRARCLRPLEVQATGRKMDGEGIAQPAHFDRLPGRRGLQVDHGPFADELRQVDLPDDERARAHHAHDLGRRANRRIDVLGRNRRAPALGKGILPARCRRGEGDRRQKNCSG